MANDLIKEPLRRGSEAFSLLSCAANVFIGTGDREVTLSAGSWELRSNGSNKAVRAYGHALVAMINTLNWPFNGPHHCAKAWAEHAPIWAKVAADRT